MTNGVDRKKSRDVNRLAPVEPERRGHEKDSGTILTSRLLICWHVERRRAIVLAGHDAFTRIGGKCGEAQPEHELPFEERL